MSNFKKLIAKTSVTVLLATQLLNNAVYGAAVNDPEFDASLSWMASHGLTKFSTADTFRPFDTVTREQAAKFYAEFAKTTGKTPDTSKNCTFSDVKQADPTLVTSIVESCQLGLMNGKNGQFMPKAPLSKAQAITVLVRLLEGAQDETQTPWWSAYFTKAKELGLTTESNVMALDRNLIRYELALLLCRSNEDCKCKATPNAKSCSAVETPSTTGTGKTEPVAGGDDFNNLISGLFPDETTPTTTETKPTTTTETTKATTETKPVNTVATGTTVVGSGADLTLAGGEVAEVSLNPTNPVSKNIPKSAQSVEFVKFDVAAGKKDVTITNIKIVRDGLGSRTDFDKIWVTKGGVTVSNTKTLSSTDDATVTTNILVKAGTVETFTVVASLNGNTSRINNLSVTEISASSTIKGLPLVGNAMTTVDYAVARIQLEKKGTDTNVNVGETQKTIGEFRLTENQTGSKKGVQLMSLRFKNSGSAKLTSNITNMKLYDGSTEVSTSTVVDGDYVTFIINKLLIEDAKSKMFAIKGDITSGRDGDTVSFDIKDKFDIYGLEESTNIGADVTLTDSTLATYTLNAGNVTIATDTSNPSSIEVVKNTDDILTMVAKVTTDQSISVDSLRLFVADNTVIKASDTYTSDADNTIRDLNDSVEKVKVFINDKILDTVDTITDANNDGKVTTGTDYYNFNSSFTLKNNDLIKVQFKFTNRAGKNTFIKFKIDNAGTDKGKSKSLQGVQYETSTDKIASTKLAGTSVSNGVKIVSSASGVSISRNDGYSSGQVFLAGEQGAVLFKMLANAGSSSSMKIKKMYFNFKLTSGKSTYTNYNNIKLKINGEQVGKTTKLTSGGSGGVVTIEDINFTVAKNGQATIELLSDIDSSTKTDNILIGLSNTGGNSVYYDMNDNEISMKLNNSWYVNSQYLAIKDNAALTLAVDGDTPKEKIIVANTTDVELAKFKFTATDGDINIKKIYMYNAGSGDRIKQYTLYANGKKLDSRGESNKQILFTLGSDSYVLVPKNQDVVITIKGDVNDITSADQTNGLIVLKLTNLEAQTKATSVDLTTANSGKSIGAGRANHYDTTVLNLAANTLYSRRTQPTLATQDIGTSKLANGQQTIYKVSVTADSKKTVTVGQIMFDVAGKINGKSTWSVAAGGTQILDASGTVLLKDFKLYVGGSEKQSSEYTLAVTSSTVTFTLTGGKEVDVAAGGSTSFELKATAQNVVTNDYVTTKVVQDSYVRNNTFANLSAYKFVWSDNSGNPHSRTTTDWYNGYKVNGLDTTATTLSN